MSALPKSRTPASYPTLPVGYILHYQCARHPRDSLWVPHRWKRCHTSHKNILYVHGIMEETRDTIPEIQISPEDGSERYLFSYPAAST